MDSFIFFIIGQIDFDLLLDSVVTSVTSVTSVTYVQPTFSNGHKSAIFKAMDLKFCMKVYLDDL